MLVRLDYKIMKSLHNKSFERESRIRTSLVFKTLQRIKSLWLKRSKRISPHIISGEELLSNHVVYRSILSQYRDKLLWFREPLSGYIYPNVNPKVIINSIGKVPADIRVLWEVNRLHVLPILGYLYLLCRDSEYAKKALQILNSWMSFNPVGKGPNWAEAMGAAIRGINISVTLALLYSYIINNYHECERLVQGIITLLFEHGKFIYHNIIWNSSTNNLMASLLGLLVLGHHFLGLHPYAKEWLKLSYYGLLKEVPRQLNEDGIDYEESTSYHAFVTEILLYAYMVMRELKLKISSEFKRRLSGALDFLALIIKPSGFIPLFGDNDSGIVIELVPRDRRDKRYLIVLGLKLGLLDASKHYIKKFLSLEVPEAIFVDSIIPRENKGIKTSSNALEVIVQYKSDYIVMKSQKDYLAVRVPREKFIQPKSHKHCDVLSYELSLRGDDIIVDPGVYLYTASLSERNLYRSPNMHNVVVIDGVGTCRWDESEFFSWLYYGATAVKIANEHKRVHISASYKPALSSPAIYRKWIYDAEQSSLIMIDRLVNYKGYCDRLTKTFLHFGPNINVEVNTITDDNRGRAILKLVNSKGRLHTVSVMCPNCESFDVRIMKYWYAPTYGSRTEAHKAVITWKSGSGFLMLKFY